MGREYSNIQEDKSSKHKKFIQKEEYPIMTRKRSNSFHQSLQDEYLLKNEIQIKNGNGSICLDFKEINFPESLQSELKKSGFTEPTPIQASAWPSAIKGRDCLAIAKTGSGKTCGYLLPAMTQILKLGKVSNYEKSDFGPSMLIMAPTRELCMQICDEAQKFGKSSGLTCCAIYGGASKGPQIGDLQRGADIVIATPGRLLDFLQMTDFKTRRIVLKLDRTSILVLDEADRMLDMGFEKDILKIITYLISQQRQTMFFTATWPKEVQKIADKILKNPVEIKIGNPNQLNANKDVIQEVKIVQQDEKYGQLKQLLKNQEKDQRVIIFCNKKVSCYRMGQSLYRDGFNIAAIHGDLEQHEREEILRKFKSGQTPMLLATDVAARGLDIKEIIVINYDFPNVIEDYIHRIGRSGRAGQSGLATTFFTEDDAKHAFKLVNILKEAKQQVAPELETYARQMGKHLNSKEKKSAWFQQKRGFGGGRGGFSGGRGRFSGGRGGFSRGGFNNR